MFPIPPNKPPISPPKGPGGVAPVEKINDRRVQTTTESPSEAERRGRRERRKNSGPRIKGYDFRSGRDRRKNPRTTPIIDLDV
ncbi:MAG: hypothetical protein RL497_1169 [Pseudomonadota bacterium]|jgi:hypothetical protein